MARPERWWAGNDHERFWLESTDRDDLGADLRAPLTDESGHDNWRYTLFQEAEVGDLVFHYDKRVGAITAVSRIAGEATSAPIVWAARGSYARGRDAQPVEVPGYRIPLTEHRILAKPLTLENLRAAKPAIENLHEGLRAAHKGALYFPFELSDRPVRPLQGYAFKLPADFVAVFGLHNPPADHADEGANPDIGLDEKAVFRGLVVAIEDAFPQYAVAQVQRFRASNKGMARVSKALFGREPKGDDWTFHRGGREELQFNLGIDQYPNGERAFRSGVAFSFEPSRSYPDIEVLVPKVARFNAWLRENAEAFPDLTMWHYEHGERSQDYRPMPIAASLIHPKTFVFLGTRQPLNAADPHAALQTLDRLFDLYRWVETRPLVGDMAIARSSTDTTLESVALELLRLDGGREIEGGRWITATTRERSLDIFLRHAEMQRRLRDELLAEGCAEVILEAPIGQRAVDVVARHGAALWFYEVKTSATVRGCLREAIGQLLEYALWPGATRPERLVVVGEPPLTASAVAYLAVLNETFPIPIEYRQQLLAD